MTLKAYHRDYTYAHEVDPPLCLSLTFAAADYPIPHPQGLCVASYIPVKSYCAEMGVAVAAVPYLIPAMMDEKLWKRGEIIRCTVQAQSIMPSGS